MAESHRTMTIAYDAAQDEGMTLNEIADRLTAMLHVGIPGEAVVKIETLGAKGDHSIGRLIASDR